MYSGNRPRDIFRRQHTDAAEPLLSPESDTLPRDDSAVFEAEGYPTRKMGFFDNLRGWDKSKKTRYLILLALSLSGDGWSYEAGVMASIFQLPSWVAHLGYPGELNLPEYLVLPPYVYFKKILLTM